MNNVYSRGIGYGVLGLMVLLGVTTVLSQSARAQVTTAGGNSTLTQTTPLMVELARYERDELKGELDKATVRLSVAIANRNALSSSSYSSIETVSVGSDTNCLGTPRIPRTEILELIEQYGIDSGGARCGNRSFREAGGILHAPEIIYLVWFDTRERKEAELARLRTVARAEVQAAQYEVEYLTGLHESAKQSYESFRQDLIDDYPLLEESGALASVVDAVKKAQLWENREMATIDEIEKLKREIAYAAQIFKDKDVGLSPAMCARRTDRALGPLWEDHQRSHGLFSTIIRYGYKTKTDMRGVWRHSRTMKQRLGGCNYHNNALDREVKAAQLLILLIQDYRRLENGFPTIKQERINAESVRDDLLKKYGFSEDEFVKRDYDFSRPTAPFMSNPVSSEGCIRLYDAWQSRADNMNIGSSNATTNGGVRIIQKLLSENRGLDGQLYLQPAQVTGQYLGDTWNAVRKFQLDTQLDRFTTVESNIGGVGQHTLKLIKDQTCSDNLFSGSGDDDDFPRIDFSGDADMFVDFVGSLLEDFFDPSSLFLERTPGEPISGVPGCTTTEGYSPENGIKCDSVILHESVTIGTLPPGCMVGDNFSRITGARCVPIQ